jgi:DNA polymerase
MAAQEEISSERAPNCKPLVSLTSGVRRVVIAPSSAYIEDMGAPAALETAAPLIPPRRTLRGLREAAAGCKACDLWQRGTQTVFGAGAAKARVMLVGEQPGNDEDLKGKPFVGPAGKLLDKALELAGIDRRTVYVTNVVKHFKWEPRGKRRIHAKPNAQEIRACRPWLEAELDLVHPDVIVCLGATAAQALLGRSFRVSQERGRFAPSPLARAVTATVHPSSILRAPDDETRRAEMKRFVEDLRGVAKWLENPRGEMRSVHQPTR